MKRYVDVTYLDPQRRECTVVAVKTALTFFAFDRTQWVQLMRQLLLRQKWTAGIGLLSFFAVLLVDAASTGRAANGSVAYAYDALGRVTTASYDTGVCIVYTYDANGNRLSETINVTASGATGVWGCFNWNASGGAKWGP